MELKGKGLIGTYEKKKDAVQLLGTATTLRETRWGDPNYDTWACAPVITNPAAHGHVKDIDLLFEMHNMEYWQTIQDRLNNCGLPIMMQKKVPQIKQSITYPLSKVQDMTKNNKMSRFFTSTIAYMIALAIYVGYKKILLYGIHMSSEEEEYSRQRDCCNAWLGYADAKGIDWFVPDDSQLMKCGHLYGYEQKDAVIFKLLHNLKGLENGKKQLETQKADVDKRYHEQNGAISYMNKLIKQLDG